MQKGIIIGVIVAVAIIGGVLASPLFYEVEVNEPLPVALDRIQPGLTLSKFSQMDDTSRQTLVEDMSENVKEMIMKESAKSPTSISEGMEMMDKNQISVIKNGNFVGLAGHQAMGLAKIIKVGDSTFLRFEDFEVTNGPDLRVYLTPDGDVKKGLHLEKLKGSKGNQNYELKNINIEQYNSIIIYCQPFGVYFGEAKLN